MYVGDTDGYVMFSCIHCALFVVGFFRVSEVTNRVLGDDETGTGNKFLTIINLLISMFGCAVQREREREKKLS